MDPYDIIESINKINLLLKPFKQRLAYLDRILMLFIVLGIALVAGISTLFGVYVTYVLSILLIIMYFASMAFVLIKIKKESN